jgi:cell division protein FtsI/penicillin-binding protein 2
VALIGALLLGAAVVAIFGLMAADEGPDASADARAYLADWEQGDHAAMRQRVLDPPSSFDEAHQQIADNLGVTVAAYTLSEVDTSGASAIARFTATLQLDGLGEWSYDGALSFTRDGGRWLVEWTPAAMHPGIGDGQTLTRTRELPARAPILDKDGEPLVTTGAGRIVGLQPNAIDDLDQVKAALQQTLGVDPAAVDEALGAPGVRPDHFVPIITVSQASYVQAEPVIYPIPGTRFRDAIVRLGPSPGFAEHVLGRTGEITAELLDELGQPYQAGDLVGLTGIEAAYEAQLAGSPSADIQLTAGGGEVVEVLDRVEGREPRPVATTLDRAAQAAVESVLGDTDRAAAVVVVDRDGNVRAAASRPLRDFNRALAGRYPPGSTFKVVTTGALLDGGVTADTPVECAETTNAGGRLFKNFESSSLGTVPFGLAFAESCNTAFITASAGVPDADLVAAAETFGFNTEYSVGLATFGGSFPVPVDATEHAAASIGQGRVEASPLHMASVAAAVIDGTWDAPVLLQEPPTTNGTAEAGERDDSAPADGGTDDARTAEDGERDDGGETGDEEGATGAATPSGDGGGAGDNPGAADAGDADATPPARRPEPRSLPPGASETLFDLMRRVVVEGSGREAAVSGIDIAGKTGTAEFGSGDPLPTHAWFIGIRGDNAVAVLVEGGGVGGQVAAPLAGAVLAGLPGG